MSSAQTPAVLLAFVVIAFTTVAVLHLSVFPYVTSNAIPRWFLIVTIVPVVGPLVWVG